MPRLPCSRCCPPNRSRGASATRIRRIIAFSTVACTLLALLWVAQPAHAANFTVNSTLDRPDKVPGDGKCRTARRPLCTLRAAIMEANALSGFDSIGIPAGTFTLGGASGEDSAVTGDLDITDSVTITGGVGGGTTVISGGNNDRVYQIFSGATVNISSLTISDGNEASGGGIYNSGTALNTFGVDLDGNNATTYGGGLYSDFGTVTISGGHIQNNTAVFGAGITNSGFTAMTLQNFVTVQGNMASASGGGIRNQASLGSLTLNHATVYNNTAASFGGGIFNDYSMTLVLSSVQQNAATNFHGGGIENQGTITIDQSAVTDNTAGQDGGGIRNTGSGHTVTVTRSLIATNTALFGGGAMTEGSSSSSFTNDTFSFNNAPTNGAGGGLATRGTSSSSTLLNVTFDNNSAPASNGGALYEASGGTTTIEMTILANSTGGNCSGTITSGGYNIDSGTTCALSGTGDQSSANPLLAAGIGGDGTYALQTGSPAIDAGTNTGCPSVDQRGILRPQDGNNVPPATCDIGSFEFRFGID